VSYTITSGPRNPIAGVAEKSVSKETAADAWALVQQLDASDEKATIRNSSGRWIGRRELRSRATKEAN
jgi:hypothetical protein